MTHISEDLADVMAQGRHDQLIVRTRKFGTSCSLQSVLQLTDLAAVAYVRQAGKTCEYTLGSATLPTYAVHGGRIRRVPKSGGGDAMKWGTSHKGRLRAQLASGQGGEVPNSEGAVEPLLGDHDLEGT